MCTVSSATWLDAQHQYEAIAVRALLRTALHAVAAMVATAATAARTRPRPTPRRRAAVSAGAAAADPAAAQGRDGRRLGRPWCTHLPRCGHSRPSATASRGVRVWFSEKDIALGTPLLREIDRGLAKSRVGIVLVTPALLRRLQGEGIADKELSALLARDQLVPVLHETTYEALREISPLLGSRTGLSTAENPMAHVAAKLAELLAA